MIPSMLVQAVLDGVLGGRRKRSTRARRYLTGGSSSLWASPNVLMTAAGMAWGVIESLQRSRAEELPSSSPASSSRAPAITSPAPDATLPPLPGRETPGAGDPGLRMIRLAVSAANADGAMTDQEQAAILQRARADGHADLAEQEFRAGASALRDRGGSDAIRRSRRPCTYCAFTIVRADERVTPPERIYLAQLAHLLGLDRATVATLEEDTGERIDALGDQGQLGG